MRVTKIWRVARFCEFEYSPKMANIWRVLEFAKFAGEWPLLSCNVMFLICFTFAVFGVKRFCFVLFCLQLFSTLSFFIQCSLPTFTYETNFINYVNSVAKTRLCSFNNLSISG
jgi:hypothetical protein